MNKEVRELLAQIEILKNEARTLVGEDKITEAEAKMEEARALQKKVKLMEELGTEDQRSTGKSLSKDEQDVEAEYRKAFCNCLRGRMSSEQRDLLETRIQQRAMSEGVAADGGLTVPTDIQTAINRYKRTLPDLTNLIHVLPVSTISGTRVFEKIATMTALANITENKEITDAGNPTFETISYTVQKYAGIIPVSNELLADSDTNMLSYLAEWIARKSVVTRNSLIIALLKTLPTTTMADWKAMKKVLNITLDPMLAAGAVIVTNQDGYQYLDTLVDGQNRPLIKPDVTEASGNLLFGKRLIVIPNTVLATTGASAKLTAPMIIGNLQEMITMFERQGHQISSTNTGGDSFKLDQTHIRVIEREQVKTIDASAAVFGTIDVTSVV